MRKATLERKERATFAAELTHWRNVRGLSKAALAQRLNIDPSYVSHLEASREHGSSRLARRADTELDAGGALWQAWQRTDASPLHCRSVNGRVLLHPNGCAPGGEVPGAQPSLSRKCGPGVRVTHRTPRVMVR
ncbi:helix-turn-helix domain-containing protein [Streptomyces phaeochromogenes]